MQLDRKLALEQSLEQSIEQYVSNARRQMTPKDTMYYTKAALYLKLKNILLNENTIK